MEQRLEELAIWVQGGAVPVSLGYISAAPRLSDRIGGSDGYLVTMSCQEEVEAAALRLQVLGHGVWDSTRHEWIHKPQKRYAE